MPTLSCEHHQFRPAQLANPTFVCRGCGALCRDLRHPQNGGQPVLVARPENVGDAVRKGAH
jgi:hypothetical protein